MVWKDGLRHMDSPLQDCEGCANVQDFLQYTDLYTPAVSYSV